MTLELLNKAQLQILNRRSNLGYPLATAEKDYFLALVLNAVRNLGIAVLTHKQARVKYNLMEARSRF